MVKNTIFATYTETYDINTQVGKMAILGIHTPTAVSVKRMFKGFFEQYRKVKINGCDIVGVCASNQALTPAEVGLTAGQTDPRDVLNPILFKACTGEQLNLLLDKIYGSSATSFGSTSHLVTANSDDLGAYYTMLSDDSFRKFHPQGGVRISSLRPYVFKVATTQPFKWSASSSSNGYDRPIVGSATESNNTASYSASIAGAGGPNGSSGAVPSVFVSNGIEPMPWLETTYETAIDDAVGTAQTATVIASNIPRCYCGVLCLPPALLQPLYFRFQIRWSVSFRDFRPAYEIGSVGTNGGNAQDPDGVDEYGMQSNNLYYNLYNVPSSLTKEYGSFDANGVEFAEVVNEKVN